MRKLVLCALLVTVACSRSERSRAMIQNKGSDTMVNLAQAWAEEYRKLEPDVAIAVTGGGSGTGIASIINGTVDIANASREIKAEERAATVKGAMFGFFAYATYDLTNQATLVVWATDITSSKNNFREVSERVSNNFTNTHIIGTFRMLENFLINNPEAADEIELKASDLLSTVLGQKKLLLQAKTK